jgi:muramoyltetrapeptide carboxypeptidase
VRLVLNKSDQIEIIVPGYAVQPEILKLSLTRLKSLGYVPKIDKAANKKQSFHAQTDENRFRFLKKALQSKSDVIWCLRGGYGSNRLLPMLAGVKKPRTKKLLIGISDITSLHVLFNQIWKWPTLHGALLERIGKKSLPPKIEKEFWDILHGKIDNIEFKNFKPLNKAARAKKIIKGQVVGGNLMTLQSVVGTPWQLSTKNRFLFIEEIGERGYRVDRMLEHLKQAGMLKGCKGIIFGHMILGEEPNSKKSRVKEAVTRFANETNLPVLQGLDSGHGKNLRALPFLTNAVLNLKSKTLKVDCRFSK